MAHTFTNLLTHIIFSTKDRMPTLEPDILSPLPGLGLFCSVDPRLAPWATISRHSVASK